MALIGQLAVSLRALMDCTPLLRPECLDSDQDRDYPGAFIQAHKS